MHRGTRAHSRSLTVLASYVSLTAVPSLPPRLRIFWNGMGRRKAGTAQWRRIVYTIGPVSM